MSVSWDRDFLGTGPRVTFHRKVQPGRGGPGPGGPRCLGTGCFPWRLRSLPCHQPSARLSSSYLVLYTVVSERENKMTFYQSAQVFKNKLTH